MGLVIWIYQSTIQIEAIIWKWFVQSAITNLKCVALGKLNNMTTDFEGPSLWHGREINSCVKCKWLKSRLIKSGKDPDYDFLCQHPTIMNLDVVKEKHAELLKHIKEKYPLSLEAFTRSVEGTEFQLKTNGQFISNDSYGPETPGWCPIVKQKADEAGKE